MEARQLPSRRRAEFEKTVKKKSTNSFGDVRHPISCTLTYPSYVTGERQSSTSNAVAEVTRGGAHRCEMTASQQDSQKWQRSDVRSDQDAVAATNGRACIGMGPSVQVLAARDVLDRRGASCAAFNCRQKARPPPFPLSARELMTIDRLPRAVCRDRTEQMSAAALHSTEPEHPEEFMTASCLPPAEIDSLGVPYPEMCELEAPPLKATVLCLDVRPKHAAVGEVCSAAAA
jgi:hypothetical protein